jgi:hypothetical protein
MTPLPTTIVTIIQALIISITVAVVATTVGCFFSKAQGCHSLGDVLRDALAALLGSTSIIVAVSITIISAARSRARARHTLIDFFACSRKGASSGKVFEAAARTATAVTSLGGGTTTDEMTSGKTCQRRFNDVTPRVLFGVFIDETIGTGRSDSCSKDAFALGASPVARILARFEGFHGTGCQGSARGLSKALFTALTVVAITVTTTAARSR